MDILAALNDTATSRGNQRCKIGRWLDGIPADAVGRELLIEAFETEDRRSEQYRTLDQLDALSAKLDCPTSIKTIGDHRGRRCRCHH